MRRYDFSRGTAFPRVVLTLATLFTIYMIVAQTVSGGRPQAVAVALLALLAIGWYLHLRIVYGVTVDGAEVTFRRGLRHVQVVASDITRIRPFLNLSRETFIIEHARGFELIVDDPATLSVLVRDLAQVATALQVRGVPPPPGEAARA